jgi:uncharacterized Zn finger protein
MPITEATIRNLATAQSFARGEDYYHSGAVYELQKRGDTLIAQVEGSSYEPYQVTIELTEDQIISTYCTCPYDWGDDCKNQAESIMDGGKSKYYHHAIRWLERARRAYLGAGQAEEWLAYLEGLIEKHARKYSLRPQLEGLRGAGN